MNAPLVTIDLYSISSMVTCQSMYRLLLTGTAFLLIVTNAAFFIDDSSLQFSTYPNWKIGNRRKFRISKYRQDGADESSSQEIYFAILRFMWFSIIFLLVNTILKRQPSIILYLNNEINHWPWKDQMSKIQVNKPIGCTTLIILSK